MQQLVLNKGPANTLIQWRSLIPGGTGAEQLLINKVELLGQQRVLPHQLATVTAGQMEISCQPG